MAKFTYKCKDCDKIMNIYGSAKCRSFLCECGGSMEFQMPKTSNSTTYEKPNKESSTKWIEDHQQVIKSRKEKYFWQVEVPRLVASGIYSKESMLQNGWITITEEGKIVVNTVPPSQR